MIRTKIVLFVCAFALVVAIFLACNAIFESAQIDPGPFAHMRIVLFGTVVAFLVLLGLEWFVRKAIEQGTAIPLAFSLL